MVPEKQSTPCRAHRWAGQELMLRSDVLTRYKLWANCYDVIGPNEPPLTGFSADSGHQAAEQETLRDAAVCAEPGSHIILSTPGERPERSSEEAQGQRL